jgi:DNA-directed RNA polymerase subunit alpha
METTLDLREIIQQEEFTPGTYEAMKGLAFSGREPFNRFLELLHSLEDEANVGEGGTVDAALKLGAGYLVLANYEKAVDWLGKADACAERSYFLGQAYLAQGQYEAARVEFERAQGEGWERLECAALQADCLAQVGECGRAAGILEENRVAGQDSVHWHYGKGRVAEQEGNLEEAIEHYEAALECDDQHAPVMFQLAYLLDLHGSDERALELYESCAELPFVHANALMNLSVIHEDNGEYEQAAQCLRRVLAVNPNNLRAQLYLKDVTSASDMYIDEQEVKDREQRDAILDIPVSDFELSVRSRNCLKKMNIHTLGDLLNASEHELLAYKNFGETSLREIKAMLEQKSLSLGQNSCDKATSGAGAQESEPEQDELELLGKSVSVLKLSVRSRKCLQRLGINIIGDLTARTEGELLESRNFGQTSLREIKGCLADISLSLRLVE